MEALQAIATRRSVRSFKADPVPRDQLVKLIDAGRLAPTARNVQPWEFVVVTDPERRRQIAAISDHGKFIADAPVCIAVLCQDTKYYVEDGSAATTNILLAATALGLATCWVAGDKKAYAPQIVSLCGAPSEMKLVSLIAVGHPVDIPSPPKRPLDDVVHWETF
jgi:nitroreductase